MIDSSLKVELGLVMNPDSLLLFIFQEHIGSASIIPFIPSVTLEAMQLFGGYALQKPALAALAGLIIGCALNWLLGFAIAWVRGRVSFLGAGSFPKMERFFGSYGFAITALFWLPLGAILLVIAGFFRTPLWKIMLAVTIGGAFHLSHFFV